MKIVQAYATKKSAIRLVRQMCEMAADEVVSAN